VVELLPLEVGDMRVATKCTNYRRVAPMFASQSIFQTAQMLFTSAFLDCVFHTTCAVFSTLFGAYLLDVCKCQFLGVILIDADAFTTLAGRGSDSDVEMAVAGSPVALSFVADGHMTESLSALQIPSLAAVLLVDVDRVHLFAVHNLDAVDG